MNLQLPPRIQAELQAAEALESADRAARASAPITVLSAADLIPPAPVQAVIATPPVTAQVAQPPAPRDEFEQKYKTLQGMYNADVTKLQRALTDVTATVQTLVAKAASPGAAPAADTKDIEKFGEEMMEMVQRYVTSAVQALEAKIIAIEASLTGVTQSAAQSAEQQFYTLLSKLAPNWEVTNKEHGWLVWLGVRDKVYGVPRQKALDHAFEQQDAAQVAAVFNAYTESIPVPPVIPTLDDQLNPSGAGNPVPLTPASKPLLSTAAINSFYNDVARGRYEGRQDEHDAIEAQINSAVAEGRVR